MRRICLLLSIFTLLLSACQYKGEETIKNGEGSDFVNWKDPYFEKLCSEIFKKNGNEITYDDLSEIEEIKCLNSTQEVKVGIYLSDVSEMMILEEPKKSMKSMSDLLYFKNLRYFETNSNRFTGTEVLAELPKLKTLIIKGKVDKKQLERISVFSYVETLKIYCQDVDFSPLAQMPNLKTIEIIQSYNAPAMEYQLLLTLPSDGCLIDLECLNSAILTPELCELLRTHPNVSSIGTLNNKYGDDLSFLANLTELKKLDIVTNHVGGISKMTWLESLSIRGGIDPSMLSELTNLKTLSISAFYAETPPVFSFETLKKMKDLQKLTLSCCIVPSLNGIEMSPNLESFSCTYCLVEDITALRALRQLEYLDLSSNLITDISPLQFLTKLKYVSLALNEISDITPLKESVNLEFLRLDINYISDIRALANLPKLEEIQIEVRDLDTLENINLALWRNTLLSLPSLKFFDGGKCDDEWIKQYLPNVVGGRSDTQGRPEVGNGTAE